MEQRNSLQFFLLVAGIGMFLFVLTFGLYSAANAIASDGGRVDYFDKNTKIGPIVVDGLSKSQASQLLIQKTSDWSINHPFSLQFIFEESDLNGEMVQFLIEESVVQAVSGKNNTLYTQVNQEKWEASLSTLQVDGYRELVDENRLKQSILDAASTLMIIEKPIHITRYFKANSSDKTLLTSESIKLSATSFGSSSWIEKHGEVKVKEDEVFSLNDLLLLDTEGLYNAPFQNEVSSLLYKVALNSPFSIIERHITTNNILNREIGYEAFVDTTHDLRIKNEYGIPLIIASDLAGDELTISVYSENTPIRVQAEIDEKKELKQRVIVRPITLDQQERMEPGKNGTEVKVSRTVFIEGSPWKNYSVSQDSYLPVHEVWYKYNDELLNDSGTSDGTYGNAPNVTDETNSLTPPTVVTEDKGYEEVDPKLGDGYVGK